MRPQRLHPVFVEGLPSCVRNSGLMVVLLTYNLDLCDVPAGVIVHDARDVLPWAGFARLSVHTCVQHLSVYVRALALARGIAALKGHSGGGWLVDGDTMWLRSAPELSVDCPAVMGHWLACRHVWGGTKPSTRT